MSNATPSYAPPPMGGQAGPITVLGPQFVAAYQVDLIITKKFMAFRECSFAVTDYIGNVMFKVKGSYVPRHDTRLLLDYADRPIVCLRERILSGWDVYRRESSNAEDLLFTVKKSSIAQLDVFLAQNANQQVPDFKIKGSTIYLGDSSTAIAEINKKQSFRRTVLGKDTFGVIVYPNVDFAFVVTLFIALYEIDNDSFFKSLIMSDIAINMVDAIFN